MGLADGISNMGESSATSKVNFVGLKMFARLNLFKKMEVYEA
jgi:hypothetical protein